MKDDPVYRPTSLKRKKKKRGSDRWTKVAEAHKEDKPNTNKGTESNGISDCIPYRGVKLLFLPTHPKNKRGNIDMTLNCI